MRQTGSYTAASCDDLPLVANIPPSVQLLQKSTGILVEWSVRGVVSPGWLQATGKRQACGAGLRAGAGSGELPCRGGT